MNLRCCYALGLALIAGPGWVFATGQDYFEITPEQQQALGVRLEHPQPAPQLTAAPMMGQVLLAPDAEWVVTAPAAGVVVRLDVTEGTTVDAGATVAEIRSTEAPKLAAMLLKAESAAGLANRERARDRKLHEEGIIAARRVDASERAAAEAQAELQALRTQLELMGLSSEAARKGQVHARSPERGVVLERLVSPGARVDEAEPLLRLGDLNRLILKLDVQIESADFRIGEELQLPEGVRATVIQPGLQVNPEGQTVRVLAALPNATSQFRPGQWIPVERSRTLGGGAPQALPAAALVRHEGRSVVFVSESGGFRAVPVEAGYSPDGRVLVTGDLTVESSVAISGTSALKAVWLEAGAE